MKKLIYIIPLLFLPVALIPLKASAQRFGVPNMLLYDNEKFHFGFVLGANLSYVTIKPVADMNTLIWDSTYIPDILPLPDSARILSIEGVPTPGFVISIVSDMRMGDHFNLRFIPSLAFGDRDLVYNLQTFRDGDTSVISITKRIPSTYISFPVEIKYKSKRYNNFRTYLLTGVQYTLDLASQAKKREQKSADQKIVKFNQNDLYVEAGIGFDFYNEWFKFGVELKMMYGLMDVLTRENNIYTDGIARLNSKIFQLSLTFE
ncbi:MAG: PorT family protein [Bacteroidales bacterium]|nr:PorT family protein [Bacteroidales bacterium]